MIIPSSINGYPVTAIGGNAFSNLYSMTSVSIPNSITTIGSWAFYDSSLGSVTIPGSVTNIGDGGFAYCYSLTGIAVDASNPTYASASGVLFNKTLTKLVQYPGALDGNNGDYPMPDGVTSIGNYAFSGCSALTSVTMSNAVTNIGDGAFQDCSGLTAMAIPDSVTSIGNEVFENCSGLKSVTIGNGVTNIGERAFYECFGLMSVTIPNSVTSIGKDAFTYCGLTNITVSAGNLSYASVGGVLFNKTITTLIQCPPGLAGSYAIPNSVINIGEDAFYLCSQLTNVTIGASLATIGDWAFFGCSGLKSVALPDSVTSIGKYAFYQAGLRSVTFGNSLTNIGTEAFYDCPWLTIVTIPDSVTSIGKYAFLYCSRLTNVAVNPGNPNFASTGGVLFNKTMTTLILCPEGLADLVGSYAIPDNVTNLGDGAFVGSSGLTLGLTNVTIGNSVIRIGDSAFWGCHNLTSITIPSSVASIGNYGFAGCAQLHQAYFQGNAPSVNGGSGSTNTTVFSGETGTAYFLPGTTGWGATFGGWPAVTGSYQPQPQILGPGYGLGGQGNRFRFTISWATNATVVVETSTNLLNWIPLVTNALANGAKDLSDLTWTNYPQRFYRVRLQ